MIRHLRMAPLLVAFYVLASAATAYAECAWVLWNRRMYYPEDILRGRPWEFLTTFPSQRECRAWIQDKVDASLKREAQIGGPAPRPEEIMNGMGVTYFKAEKPEMPLALDQWICVPDTVDPRGPTGK